MKETWKDIPHSMFDFREYYDRIADDLPSPCRIAEVGVADGASAIYLAEKLTSIGKDFSLKMIDNMDYGKTEQLKTIMDNVLKSGLSERIEIMPYDSLNASLKFPDNYFDFVFIDSGHTFELTKAEIRLWMRKIKDGGILAGHDYLGHQEVRDAVSEMLNGYPTLSFHETEKNYGVWEVRKNHQETPL